MVIAMDETIRYLRKYIDENATYEKWTDEAKKSLNLYLIGAFDYYIVSLLGERALFLVPAENYAPAKMENLLRQIEEKTGLNGVLVLNEASRYIVRKFLENRVGFIVPGKQISLPFLAMQIKSEKTHAAKEIVRFSPVTQMTFLYIIYSEEEKFELNTIAGDLNVSLMTATRAMRDLTDAGLLVYEIGGKTGRKKVFTRISAKDYYAEGRKYLDSPVRDVIYIKEVPEGIVLPRADLTALSEQTMLADSGPERFCLPYKDRAILDKYTVTREVAIEEHLPMVQLMKYDTGCLSRNGYEDPLSMILGLSEVDERIEIAIDELMEGYEWYEV